MTVCNPIIFGAETGHKSLARLGQSYRVSQRERTQWPVSIIVYVGLFTMANDWEGHAAVGNVSHHYFLARFELFRVLFPS